MTDEHLTLEAIADTRQRLGDRITTTPSIAWTGTSLAGRLSPDTEVAVKLEVFQRTGTFKARGAMNVIMQLEASQLERGLTAVSAGNHAIAVAWCAQQAGASAKIFMPRSASPRRVELTRQYGAEIHFCDSLSEMFVLAEREQKDAGRTFVHPFEGPFTVQGTATAGLEFTQQVAPVDAMILPIGGGGLCAGFAACLKQLWPEVTVYGVEPEGADTMSQSFAAGAPVQKAAVSSIADSLAPPMATPYTYGVCRRYVDEIVTVTDAQLRDAMRIIFYDLKLAVEPAGAATTAALCGPLRDRLAGQRVGVITCGSNIALDDYYRLAAGE